MKTANVIVVEENIEEAETLVSELSVCSKLSLVGGFDNTDEAIKVCDSQQIDLAIINLVLKGTDGFEFMAELKNTNKNMKIIMLSSIGGENLIKKAILNGADYFMIKPVKTSLLIERSVELVNESYGKNKGTNSDLREKGSNQLEDKLSTIFISVGIPAHIKGYHFLREAIKMAVESPEVVNKITKELYPNIATKFDTSASKVERAIRHAIEVAWNRGRIENINSLFGIKVYGSHEKPTNGEFIALLADKMLLDGYSACAN